ncbi:hypothetical protein GpartN1_g5663.t1 [Galdieria partita]|uniref:CCT domain-containing protein n=1 Tax=Galdieria partita TaxID=83374 RepID=A0A9C7Q2A3_9RHOD|nr:hypothetical protein GpartN1_g5663.t1 [Galdieria partita]
MKQQMFDERQPQEHNQGESSRQHDSPTRRPHSAVGTFSLYDTNYPYENPTPLQRNLQPRSYEERSYEHTSSTNSPGIEECIDEWRLSQLVAMPSRYHYPSQSSHFPRVENLSWNPPQVPLSSDFFTILAQYHAYAVNRAQETRQRRCESIKKYREKKRRRNSNRTVKYQMRKQLAESRIRGPRGRFIRKDEEKRILQSQQASGEICDSRGQSSPDCTASFGSTLQQKREAFVSPRFFSSPHRKSDGGRQPDCNWFAADTCDYPPLWQYFP